MNRRRRRHRGGAGSKVLFVAIGVAALLAIGVVGVISWVLDVAADAPSLAACRPVEKRGNTTIYAGDGSSLGRVRSDEAREPVAIGRIPKSLQHATVAIEDERFYEHGGVDPEAIARAALKNLEAGRTVEGGSTIAQQLVRNLCLRNPARDIERKIVEAKLAIEYAERHSKREILDAYLNTASYGTIEGATAVGVTVVALLVWIVRALIDHRRWLRLSRVQTDVHTKLMDRLTNNEDLLAYIQSPAGRRFLESAPIALDGEPRPAGAPLGRILWSLQAGIVLVALGLGFWFAQRNVFPEIAEGFHVVGVIIVALGVGFTVSGVAAYLISTRLGLMGGNRATDVP